MTSDHEKLPMRSAADILSVSDMQHITVSKDDITITAGSYPYSIPLHRCSTPEAILGWVTQLTQKTWCDRTILRGFIRAACSAHNIQITYG